MNVEQLMKNLETKTGMHPLQFSDEGVITFVVDDRFTISIEKSDDGQFLSIYSVVGTLPLENRQECMKWLLDANLFGYKTNKASFGLDSDTEEIYLFQMFDLFDLQFDRFFDYLTQFIETLKKWTEEFQNHAYQMRRSRH